MRISIDLDGCLWHHQAFFRVFMQVMQKDGHEVGILTSHKVIHEAADRALLEKRGFPKPDFYIGRPLDWNDGNYHIFKAQALRAHKIDYHFDDGDAEKIRALLGDEAWRVISVAPRGGEDQHYE